MLRKRLKALEDALLPDAQDPAGNYPPEQVERTRAYLVLAHSEFESFLERSCRRTALTARAKVSAGKPSQVAIAVASYYDSGAVPPPSSWTDATNTQRSQIALLERVVRCFDAYEETVTGNNGIKQSSLVKLLAPLGVDLGALAEARLLECDGFGEVRGNLAHGKAQQIIDPFSEKATVDRLEVFFADLDKHLAGLS